LKNFLGRFIFGNETSTSPPPPTPTLSGKIFAFRKIIFGVALEWEGAQKFLIHAPNQLPLGTALLISFLVVSFSSGGKVSKM
jgi:hypothetical protein